MTIDNPEELRARLDERRKAMNLTVVKLAALAGVDRNTCASVLAGGKFRWESLLAVANAIRNEELRLREALEISGCGDAVSSPAGASRC